MPVALVTAVRDLDLHFRQLHEKDGAPIEVQRWCSKEDIEVPYEEITHGYEFEDGGQVIVSDLELQAIEPRRTRTIEIEHFVDLEDVDPIYFDHPYFLVPASDDDGSIRAYRLLTEVMGRTDRAALGPVRDARQGVPGDRARARRRADADDDAASPTRSATPRMSTPPPRRRTSRRASSSTPRWR